MMPFQMTRTMELAHGLQRELEIMPEIQRVHMVHDGDMNKALTDLRDSGECVAVVTMDGDEIIHTFIEDTNIPERVELRGRARVTVVSGRNTRLPGADTQMLDFRDRLFSNLCWATLGLPGVLVLPINQRAIRIEWDGGHTRDAWEVELEMRREEVEAEESAE